MYIDSLMHSCKDNETTGSHYIRDCKGKKKWVEHFLTDYKNGKWQPKLYDKSISYE